MATQEKVQLNNEWRKEQLKNIVAKYTTFDDLDAFWQRNEQALDGLIKGQSISEVMTGFRAKNNPEKTYDARMEVSYTKNQKGENILRPQFHFKNQELFIADTFPLQSALTKEVVLQDENFSRGKLECEVEIDSTQHVKIALNEAQVTELRTQGRLSKSISSENPKYAYEVKSVVGKEDRIDKIVLFQKEKVQISPEDITQLKETGRLDHTLKAGEGVNERQYFVAVDKDLNKLAFAPLSIITSRMDFKNIKLSDENKAALMRGKKTHILMPYTDKDGSQKKGNALMYFDPIRRNMKIEFVNQSEQKQEQKQEQKVPQKAVRSQALQNVEKATQQQTQTQSTARKQKRGQSL